MRKLIYIFVLAAMPWFSVGCEKEHFVTDDGAVKLEFSVDTLTFDTVFTTIGTTTRMVTVYNRSDDNMKLTSVSLDSGYHTLPPRFHSARRASGRCSSPPWSF